MSKTARTLLLSTCSATKENPFVLMTTAIMRMVRIPKKLADPTIVQKMGSKTDLGLSCNNPTLVKIGPGKQVVLQDRQSSRSTVICTCSLLCWADAGTLQINHSICCFHLCLCLCLCVCLWLCYLFLLMFIIMRRLMFMLMFMLLLMLILCLCSMLIIIHYAGPLEIIQQVAFICA